MKKTTLSLLLAIVMMISTLAGCQGRIGVDIEPTIKPSSAIETTAAPSPTITPEPTEIATNEQNSDATPGAVWAKYSEGIINVFRTGITNMDGNISLEFENKDEGIDITKIDNNKNTVLRVELTGDETKKELLYTGAVLSAIDISSIYYNNLGTNTSGHGNIDKTEKVVKDNKIYYLKHFSITVPITEGANEIYINVYCDGDVFGIWTTKLTFAPKPTQTPTPIPTPIPTPAPTLEPGITPVIYSFKQGDIYLTNDAGDVVQMFHKIGEPAVSYIDIQKLYNESILAHKALKIVVEAEVEFNGDAPKFGIGRLGYTEFFPYIMDETSFKIETKGDHKVAKIHYIFSPDLKGYTSHGSYAAQAHIYFAVWDRENTSTADDFNALKADYESLVTITFVRQPGYNIYGEPVYTDVDPIGYEIKQNGTEFNMIEQYGLKAAQVADLLPKEVELDGKKYPAQWEFDANAWDETFIGVRTIKGTTLSTPIPLSFTIETLPYTFKFSVGGDYCVIKSYMGNDETLVLPSSFKGLNVAQVMLYAFKDNDTLKRLVIPENYSYVFNEAFHNCTALEEIVMKDTWWPMDAPLNIYGGDRANTPNLKSIYRYSSNQIGSFADDLIKEWILTKEFNHLSAPSWIADNVNFERLGRYEYTPER